MAAKMSPKISPPLKLNLLNSRSFTNEVKKKLCSPNLKHKSTSSQMNRKKMKYDVRIRSLSGDINSQLLREELLDAIEKNNPGKAGAKAGMLAFLSQEPRNFFSNSSENGLQCIFMAIFLWNNVHYGRELASKCYSENVVFRRKLVEQKPHTIQGLDIAIEAGKLLGSTLHSFSFNLDSIVSDEEQGGYRVVTITVHYRGIWTKDLHFSNYSVHPTNTELNEASQMIFVLKSGRIELTELTILSCNTQEWSRAWTDYYSMEN